MIPRFMTAFFNFVQNRTTKNLTIPEFKTFLFMMAMSVIAYAYTYEKETMKPIVKTYANIVLN